jgi:CelD/BcsL family acetyltransferase involved in cellulose biosynthesis
MSTLFELHRKRWSVERDRVFASEDAQAFHRDFASAALDRGWLRLWFLEVDGTSIAAWYGWRLGRRYLYYQAGLDPAWAKHSPGLVLLAHTIRSALEEGAAEYDMLLGDEAYKARFADAQRSAGTLMIMRSGHPARVLVEADMKFRELTRKLPPGAHDRLRRATRPLQRVWPITAAP